MPAPDRRSLGEGDTPLVSHPGLARSLGLDRLYLKREDLNPTGSHKARGAAVQVPAVLATEAGGGWLTLSSSGNAAVAAAAYAALAGARVAAFVSPDTPASKMGPLTRLGALVLVSHRAVSLAEALSKRRGIPNLRPSTHPLAPEGFQSLGWELVEAAPDVDAVFTFVSSAASFVGIGRALARGPQVVGSGWTAALHAVQGAGASPVAAEYDPERRALPAGRVGALGARKTRRIGEAKRTIVQTGGSGWIVTDEEALEALGKLERFGVETSLEGGASVAAARRAAAAGAVRAAVVILTGHASQRPDYLAPGSADRIVRVDDLESAERALDGAEPPRIR